MIARIRRRFAEGPRKGPGLAPHIPMPEADPGPLATELQQDFTGLTEAHHRTLLIIADRRRTPRATASGWVIANALRLHYGTDAEALAWLMPHLHAVKWATDLIGDDGAAYALEVWEAAAHDLGWTGRL